MTAGQNLRCTVFRYTEGTDDLVGGATVTGTAVYTNIQLRLEEQPVQQLLLQQGMEIQKTFEGIVVPGTMIIKERDEIEVTYPIEDVRYGKRFRIINARPSSMNTRDPRSYITLTLVRSERAHNIQ
jgi:hypothetical protein